MIPRTRAPARAILAADEGRPAPLYAVWELTLKCDQPCAHCGSRAGRARDEELSTDEILAVAQSLVDLGCREVALIGGEAYLHPGLLDVVRFLSGHGIRVGLQTGGRALTTDRAAALKEAGLTGVGVSIDGPARVHDKLRGNLGSHLAALRALDAAREAGLVVTSNAQINRLNYQLLREMAAELRAHGVVSWQVALTVAMGRAADRPDWILEPWMVVEVVETLAAIQLEAVAAFEGGTPFNVFCGNNIGYYGPHEHVLRSRPGGPEVVWSGCKAGIYGIGIESDGTIKGCPSLPTAPYAGGNVRETSLEAIWRGSEIVRFARDRSVDELWGFCKTCYYADECRAGCSWTAHCTLGRRGNNPFCYHRVTELRKRGVRERLVQKERAPNEPYDFGRFEIVEEPVPEVEEPIP